MDSFILDTLLSVSSFNFLLQSEFTVEYRVLCLYDVHLCNSSAGVLLGGNYSNLMPVIFKFTHYIIDYTFERVKVTA